MHCLDDVQKTVQLEAERDLSHLTHDEGLRILAYMGLSEEVGEVCGLMKRELRGFPKDVERVTDEHFIEELGDVLWYLALCCYTEGISLDDIWDYNRKKLEERYGQS